MDDHLRILVLSDLHATTEYSERSDSRLNFDEGVSEYGEGIINFIKNNEEEIDVLVCAGDIANKASLSNFEKGWEFLNKLKLKVNIPTILCVPGNHDHASRSDSEFSPKHHLQFMHPPFPLDNHVKNTHFWAWNWLDVELETFNAVLINTSAYHGYGDEYTRGRIATEVADQIYERISSSDFKLKHFNLLLCHHHPVKMEHVDISPDVEVIDGAEYLLTKLQEVDKGPWLIIHGHKHFAEITIGSSSNGSPPTILSAGSVSAKIYSSIQDRTSNQMYILDIDLRKTSDLDKLVGNFITYEYKMEFGWRLSEARNLPAKGGFGSEYTPVKVFREIKNLINKTGTFLNEDDLEPIYKMMEYFTPGEFLKLKNKLEDSGYEVVCELNKILEIGGGRE